MQFPGKTPNQLQAIFLNSIDLDECKKIHKDYVVRDSNICTFTKEGEGACHVSILFSRVYGVIFMVCLG